CLVTIKSPFVFGQIEPNMFSPARGSVCISLDALPSWYIFVAVGITEPNSGGAAVHKRERVDAWDRFNTCRRLRRGTDLARLHRRRVWPVRSHSNQYRK